MPSQRLLLLSFLSCCFSLQYAPWADSGRTRLHMDGQAGSVVVIWPVDFDVELERAKIGQLLISWRRRIGFKISRRVFGYSNRTVGRSILGIFQINLKRSSIIQYDLRETSLNVWKDQIRLNYDTLWDVRRCRSRE